MPQERREKALAILASGVDEARWAEARPRDREKRRECRDDLREERRLYEAEKRSDEYERGERDHL